MPKPFSFFCFPFFLSSNYLGNIVSSDCNIYFDYTFSFSIYYIFFLFLLFSSSFRSTFLVLFPCTFYIYLLSDLNIFIF
jgi:hypothetical protein